jgi:glycosyltransferase involved in cell wall biosynthesis
MQTPPLVSVGIPVYNGSRSLGDALTSITTQTYKNLQIIISDDASTDASASICQRIALEDHRINFYQHEVNRGAIFNFNFVLEQAFGKYFFWASQDDLRDPRYIEACVELLENSQSAVFCHTHYTDSGGSSASPCLRQIGALGLCTAIFPADRFYKAYASGIGATAFYGIFRTNELKQLGGLRNFIGSDIALFNAITLRGEFVEVPEVRFHYKGRASVRSPREHLRFLDPQNTPPKIFFPSVTYFKWNLAYIFRSRLLLRTKIFIVLRVFLLQCKRWLVVLCFKILRMVLSDEHTKILFSKIGLGNFVPMNVGHRDERVTLKDR